MKKILVSLIAVSALTGFASVAHAGGNNTPGGATGNASFTSDHTGSVDGTCSLDVTDGALPVNQGFVSSLTSTTKGKISTVCNTTTSNLSVALDTGANPGQAGYTEKFKLDGGSGAYASSLPAGFVTAYSQANLSNGFSGTPSTIDVTAQGSVPTPAILQAGTYTIKVKATVTP